MQAVIRVNDQENVSQPGHVYVGDLGVHFLVLGVGFLQVTRGHRQCGVAYGFERVPVQTVDGIVSKSDDNVAA